MRANNAKRQRQKGQLIIWFHLENSTSKFNIEARLLEHKNSDTACKQAVCVTNLFVTLLFVNALIRKTEDTRWKQF